MAWDGEIILTPPTGKTPEPMYADEGDFRFYSDGSFRFANRIFKHKQAIDVNQGGFHVFRDAGSRRVTVWCPGGERVVFQCEWTLAGARWIRWTPRAIDEVGTADEDPRPTRLTSAVLFVSRIWHNLVGAASLAFGTAMFFLVALVAVLTVARVLVGLVALPK